MSFVGVTSPAWGTALATGLSAAGSLAGGIAGAAGSGGGQLSSTQKAYNDWAAANQFNLQNKQNSWLKTANKIAKDPSNWAAYSGQRVADLTPDQQAAFNAVRQTAGGDQFLTGAQNQVNKTLNGDYLNYQAPTNQYMGKGPSTSNQFIGAFKDYTNKWEGQQPTAKNDYYGATTNAVYNPFLGMNNPYLNNAIDYAANDTIRNYQKAVTPATDAAFARAGAFGGSAWGEQTSENQRNLANTLGQQATNARMGDYTNQQNLMNSNAQFYSGLNQNDLTRNANLGENDLSRQQDAWKTNAQINQNAENTNQQTWMSNLNAQQAENQLANSQWATNAGLAQNQIDNNLRNYMAERGYQQNGINNALNLHNQGYTDANNLLQIGNQQQTQNQNNLNAAMQYYLENQNAQRAPVDWMLGNYQSAMGTAAQPSFQQQYKTNPYMGALGGAIGGYQLGSGIYNTGVNNGWWGGSNPSSSGGSGGGFSNASGLGNGPTFGGWLK